MIAVALACLVTLLGAQRFRLREAASASLAGAVEESPRVRSALARAAAHPDPEVRLRAATVLENWAAVWPTGGGQFPRLELLFPDDWIARLWGRSAGCVGGRLLSAAWARQALEGGSPRWRVMQALDDALCREARVMPGADD